MIYTHVLNHDGGVVQVRRIEYENPVPGKTDLLLQN